MGRNLSAKCKQCRREGSKLFLKGERCNSSKCAMVKRNYIPGVHGIKLGRGARLTGYGTQLREKQKAKRTYRILEKQFQGYYHKAIIRRGNTVDHLFGLLEMRLDNVVFRAGFCDSRDFARQVIRHGHVLVNGQKVDIPSFQLKIKDKLTIKPTSLKKAQFQDFGEKIKNKQVPDWLAVDVKELNAMVIDTPSLARNEPSFDLKQVIEFYSR